MGLFGGNTNESAQGQSSAAINSSGWNVGGGSASGGGLSASIGASIPKEAIISLGVILLAWVYFKKKKGK